MKFYVIACDVLYRECSRAAANSTHVVTLSFHPLGMHDKPNDLRAVLQDEIDKASGGNYDYILLAYGLCSRVTAGLLACDTLLVIPRAHDCITLLLGSKEAYQQEFEKHPGTYYYSCGWIERRGDGNVSQGVERLAEEKFREYVEKYGEENAKYLFEVESQWLANYNRTALIDMGMGDTEKYRSFTRQIAEENNWNYDEIKGDTRLVDDLINGVWPSDQFLVVKPGQKTFENVNDGIISAK
ncbi:MAG: DUF1638 domain-containing protein [Armatimonadota bacterium]